MEALEPERQSNDPGEKAVLGEMGNTSHYPKTLVGQLHMAI